MTLGGFIKQHRRSRTLTSLAKAVGVSVAYLSDVEKGRRGLTQARAREVARALGLAPDDKKQLISLALLHGPAVRIELEGLSEEARSTLGVLAARARELTDEKWRELLTVIAE